MVASLVFYIAALVLILEFVITPLDDSVIEWSTNLTRENSESKISTITSISYKKKH